MGGFPVDRGGLVRMDEDIQEGDGAVGGGVFQGEGEVASKGVDEGQEGVSMMFVSEGAKSVVHEVTVGVRGVGGGRESQGFHFCYPDLCKLNCVL